jgi:hypothetical protein
MLRFAMRRFAGSSLEGRTARKSEWNGASVVPWFVGDVLRFYKNKKTKNGDGSGLLVLCIGVLIGIRHAVLRA